MNLSIRLSLFSFVAFIMQIKFGVAQVATPWGSTQLAEGFITNFLRIIARSGAFSPNQLDEMSSIPKTLIEAMEKFSSSNTSSKIKFQALNMVFASAMAEITAEGGSANIELKVGAIENALNFAYKETMGVVNAQFVNDIKSLIYTLAHTTANGVSTASFAKVENYGQDSLKQQETYTSDKIIRINDSILQRETRPELELSNLESSLTPNVPGGYVSTSPFMARLQRPSLQNPYGQQIRGSPVTLNTKRNLQGPPGFEPQESSPPGITSVQDQKGLGGYRERPATSTATDRNLTSAGPLSSRFEVNGLVQQGRGDYKHIKEEQSNQTKSRTIDQESGNDGLIASRNYGVGKLAVGLQGISELEGKRSEIQQPSKTGGQESDGKKTAALFAIDKAEPTRDSKGLIEHGSLGSREYQQNDLQSFVAVNQKSEGYEPNYGLDAAISVSDRVRSFKSVPNRRKPQDSQGPTRKDTEGFNGYGPRVVATVVTDNYESSTGSRRSRPEEPDVQGQFRKENQYEKEIQGQVPSRQMYDIREPYETEYQETNRLEGQISDVNLPVTAGKYESSGGASPFEQGLNIRKTSKVGNLTTNSGLNDGEHKTAATVSTEVGYESTNDTEGLQGLVSNGSTSELLKSYASEFAAAVSGLNTERPIRASRISNSDDNSEISSIASSLVPGIAIKSPAVANSSAQQVSIANQSLSNCNALIQTLLDIISALVNLLGSCNIRQFNDVASILR
ncbi:uncharacterized protein LOC129976104 [Argiope bruennichi]|uniref:uncharacterized protein LOC129976104 n=1 Tax=Argiope bruennichi TaxID=94029 RepID=UPI002495172B|nr:uncharacterized protein LOC129976104 [Argiope bruennichi]